MRTFFFFLSGVLFLFPLDGGIHLRGAARAGQTRTPHRFWSIFGRTDPLITTALLLAACAGQRIGIANAAADAREQPLTLTLLAQNILRALFDLFPFRHHASPSVGSMIS